MRESWQGSKGSIATANEAIWPIRAGDGCKRPAPIVVGGVVRGVDGAQARDKCKTKSESGKKSSRSHFCESGMRTEMVSTSDRQSTIYASQGCEAPRAGHGHSLRGPETRVA